MGIKGDVVVVARKGDQIVLDIDLDCGVVKASIHRAGTYGAFKDGGGAEPSSLGSFG